MALLFKKLHRVQKTEFPLPILWISLTGNFPEGYEPEVPLKYIFIFSGCLVNTRNLLMKSTRHSSSTSRCWRRGRRRWWGTWSRPTPASRCRSPSTARRRRRRSTRSCRWESDLHDESKADLTTPRWQSSWRGWWSTPAMARCWCSRSRWTPGCTSCWPTSRSSTWPVWRS